MRHLPWIGTTVVALIGFGLGVLPIWGSAQRWVLVGLCGAMLLGVLLTFPFAGTGLLRRAFPKNNTQTVRASEDARVAQAGNDLTINGGMGDRQT